MVASDWCAGKTLAGMALRERTGALVVTLSRQGKVLGSPPPIQEILAGDVLFLFGARAQLTRSTEYLQAGSDSGAPPAEAE